MGGGRTSVEEMKHPYMQNGFWEDKANHFWNTGSYTEKGKEYLNNFVKKKKNGNRNRKVADLIHK